MKAAAETWEEIAIRKKPKTKFTKKKVLFCGRFGEPCHEIVEVCKHGYSAFCDPYLVNTPKECPHGCFKVVKTIKSRRMPLEQSKCNRI